MRILRGLPSLSPNRSERLRNIKADCLESSTFFCQRHYHTKHFCVDPVIEFVCFFNFHGAAHRNYIQIYFQRDATIHSLFISGKVLYMFRVVSLPIIRSTHNCIYSIWYLSNRYCYLLVAVELNACMVCVGYGCFSEEVKYLLLFVITIS